MVIAYFPKSKSVTRLSGKFSSSINTIATIWLKVFNLPHLLAAITTPSPAATNLKPVTTSSLAIIIKAAQPVTSFLCTKAIRAAIIRSLSAIGSRNFPRVVTIFFFLAI
jgi:hypothetical protein